LVLGNFGGAFGRSACNKLAAAQKEGSGERMKKWVFLLLILSVLSGFWGCAGFQPKFEDPKNDTSVLLIGSVIVDIFEYHHITDTFKYATDVAILGRVEENGKIKKKLFWTKTDSHGFFYLDNMPPGEYGLKGFRVKILGSEDVLAVVNDLTDSTEYYRVISHPVIKKIGNYFRYKPKNRVVDFGHNYFFIDHGKEVHAKHLYRIKDLRLVTGERLTEQPVAYYFYNRYPKSAWRNFLPVRR